LTRSRTIDLSNSAKLPSICIIMRPAGVVVSMDSVKEGSHYHWTQNVR
jgi:hypothetical protein